MISKNIYWVPTKEESEVSLQVPLQNTINSKISNEIEFKQSNELLVPGKTIVCLNQLNIIWISRGFLEGFKIYK